MKIKILALLLLCVFLFQNCATMILGTSQEIPVTSSPSGAKITVDGKERGNTPWNLRLKKKKAYVIRIEKQGYNPLEIRIIRKASASLVSFSIFTNIIWGWLAALPGAVLGMRGFIGGMFSSDKEEAADVMSTGAILAIIGLIVGWGGAIYADFTSGANYTLSPKELNVTVSKIEGKPQPNLILIDDEQFQNIKWIRIKCADSDGEEIVNLN